MYVATYIFSLIFFKNIYTGICALTPSTKMFNCINYVRFTYYDDIYSIRRKK